MRNFTILAALCVTLSACNSTTKKSVEGTGGSTENTGLSAEKQTRAAKTVRRQIPVLREFTHITNLGSVNIDFTFGDYGVEIEADSSLIDYVTTDFDCNLLTVSLGVDANNYYGSFRSPSSAKLHVTAPSLMCVTLCNAGGFTCTGEWRGDEVQLGMFGTGKAIVESVECRKFIVESSAGGTLEIGHLKADEATIATRNYGSVTIDCDVQDLSVLNTGAHTIILTGKVHEKTIYNPKDKNFNDETN